MRERRVKEKNVSRREKGGEIERRRRGERERQRDRVRGRRTKTGRELQTE